MNRFDDLLAKTKPGASFWVTKDQLGMDAHMFHEFVDTLVHAGRSGISASEAVKESHSGARLYYRVKVTVLE